MGDFLQNRLENNRESSEKVGGKKTEDETRPKGWGGIDKGERREVK